MLLGTDGNDRRIPRCTRLNGRFFVPLRMTNSYCLVSAQGRQKSRMMDGIDAKKLIMKSQK